MRIAPAVGTSKPATMRSVVVLPQPDGPRNETNSPRSMREVEVLHHDVLAEGSCGRRSSSRNAMLPPSAPRSGRRA